MATKPEIQRRNSVGGGGPKAKPQKPARSGKSKLVVTLTPDRAASVIQRRWRFHRARSAYLKIKKQITRRNKIVQEILSTEQTYLNSLKTLSKVFLKPLEESGLVEDSNEIKSLLGGIKVIVGYNSILLTDLQQRIPSWSVHSKLGDVFLRLVAFLKAYTQYVNTYKQSIDVLEKKRRTKQFVDWEAKLDTTECGGLQMGDYLIMPIQRIPRYNMLLGDLYSNTWSFHVDYENLGNAHKRIQDIALHVNASQKEAESMRKVTEILKDIQSQGNKLENLIEPWRRFIYDSQFGLPTGKSAHLYLFNDVILSTNIKKDKKVFERLTDLLNVTFSHCDDNSLAFTIKDNTASTTYIAKTEAEKKKWFDSVQEAMAARQELKKATDELIIKNIDMAKKSSKSKDTKTIQLTTSKDDITPAVPTGAERRAGFRKTASSGNLGSLGGGHTNLVTSLKEHHEEESENPQPKKGSRTEDEGGSDIAEKPDKKKSLRRTPSLKGLLNITHSSGEGSFKRPTLAGLLSPRGPDTTADSKPKTKADFYASLGKQPHAIAVGSAPSALTKKAEESESSEGVEDKTRFRGLTLTGVSGLWSKGKKKEGRERRGSDAGSTPPASSSASSHSNDSSPTTEKLDVEFVTVWKKNNFDNGHPGQPQTTTPISPRGGKEKEGWKKFL